MTPMPGSITQHSVTISDRVFPYQRPWDGTRLELHPTAPYLAFDTETEVVDLNREVPRLALASFSTGRRHGLIRPDQLGGFLRDHPGARYVCHNASFDFWAVDRHLRDRGEEEARQTWRDACDQGRLHCSMLLDMLIRLAEGRVEKRCRSDPDRILPRNLAEVAGQYTSLRITKDDPYRERYGEILDTDWGDVEEGFFEYAVKDPIVTYRAYLAMTGVAERIMQEHGYDPSMPLDGRYEIRPDAVKQFGALSEQIQVKASVVLAHMTRKGMRLDGGRVEALLADCRRRLDVAHERILADYPGLIRLDRKGNVVRSKKTGAPSVVENHLRTLLVEAAARVKAGRGVEVPIPTTPTGKLSTSAKVLEPFASEHPLFVLWVEREKLGKSCEFLEGLRGSRVHPRYSVLKRTGRTSCERPNVQNVPRSGGLRELFVPDPGHLLLAADYSYVELRTLAAVCEARYGFSRLADTIRAGIDPHCYTAAVLLGMTLERFMTLADVEDEVQEDGVLKRVKGHRFKKYRQNAKAVNFGVPGGLGARGLVDYARNTFGVTLTPGEAEAFRKRLIEEIYPELSLYLSDDTMAVLAHNLKAGEDDCWGAFSRGQAREPFVPRGVQNLVRGRTAKADGTPYNGRWVRDTWQALEDLNRNGDPRLLELLASRQGCDELDRLLFRRDVVTLTGRVRGRVGFNESRNTPFQSLASDGAKLALWDLLYRGMDPLAFIHDEILFQLTDQGGFVDLAVVEEFDAVMNRSMEKVTGAVPSACESALSTRWSKGATRTVRDGKVFPWTPEPATGLVA
jgi:hypothetical protein